MKKSQNLIRHSADALKASAEIHLGELKSSAKGQIDELLKSVILTLLLYVLIVATTLHLLYRGSLFILTYTEIPPSQYNLFLSVIVFIFTVSIVMYRYFSRVKETDPAIEKLDKLKKVAAFKREVSQALNNIKFNVKHPLSFLDSSFRRSFGSRLKNQDLDWFKITSIAAIGGVGVFSVVNYFKDGRSQENKGQTDDHPNKVKSKNENQLLTAVKGLLIAAVTSIIKEFLTELFTQGKKSEFDVKRNDFRNLERKEKEGLQNSPYTTH